VHRRLAARNVLINSFNEVKIAGFGPQPENEETGDDAEAGKQVSWKLARKRSIGPCICGLSVIAV